MSTRNERRAHRIVPTLGAYCAAVWTNGGPGIIEGEEETYIRDLLTDLQHYCRLASFDYQELTETARYNFESESTFKDDNEESEG